ncbi:DUF2782 domain-containing protein [Marinobacterium sp. AK62]|uniref:DUF2782 domain-containing protein n=1 Tax=Marinobacterium alkalitolerans TaxID=1542925 RepID=A0ABS3ZCQ8_9GAMM|nr:DUF2782 domain-containing protein [Marinobacterium alkalitolerans]MBP0049464.1 DUF2782 domain-containing protein [Marinobacterium alkalitolerans]
MLKKLTLATLLALSPLAQAEVVDDPAMTEPEITITHDGDNTYYEYTVNGQLKEIKVVPKGGKPYYLVPAQGSQKLIRVEESQLLIPKWVIFRW